MKRIASSVLTTFTLLLLSLIPALVFGQASSYQVGGPTQKIPHDAYVSGCYALYVDQQSDAPSANVTVSGPPWPLVGITDDGDGSGHASSSTQFGQASMSGVSFTAKDDASTTLPSNPARCGVYGGAVQSGTFYSFTLTQSSTVSFDVSLSGSFSGRGQYGTRGGVTAIMQLRAGSPIGAILSGFEFYYVDITTGVSAPSVHASAVLPPGDYFVTGNLGVAADQGQNASANLSVNVLIGSGLEVVGTVTDTDGTATIQPPGGTPQPAVPGTPVHPGDVISTGPQSRVTTLLSDNTELNIGESSQSTVDNYVYDPSSFQNSGVYNFFHGIFVYTSGLITKQPDPNVTIDTPVGVIGIRGTQLIANVTPTQTVIYLSEGQISVTPTAALPNPPTFQPQVFDAPITITFDQNNIATSAFDQTVYDDLKKQAEGSSTIDSTPPAINCGVAPSAWQADNVTINCSASDSGSGLADSADANFTLSTSVASGTETANAATNTHQVCDKSNNCVTSGPISGIMIDRKAPAITIASPIDKSLFTINAASAANYQCQDGGSGVKTCQGSVTSGTNIDTSTVGAKSFTVNATDNVGNASTASTSYTVGFAICPLYDGSRAVKSGATFPVKIALCDANNNDVSNSAVVVHAISLRQVSSSSTLAVQDAGDSNPNSDFRFDPTLGSSGGYNLNLKTTGLSTGTFVLSFTAGSDPTVHSAYLQVR